MYLPRKYRILGTLNSDDKEFVFEMSQALSRRFQFIHIGVPEREGAQITFREETALVARKALHDVRVKKLVPDEIPESMLLVVSKDGTRPNDTTPAGKMLAGTARLIEFIRYEEDSPGDKAVGMEVGTATFIDIIRAFLTRAFIQPRQDERVLMGALDWAVASRLIPQFEGVDPTKVERIRQYMANDLFPDQATRNPFPRSCLKLDVIIRGAL
jgi:MoxR-like ATPase